MNENPIICSPRTPASEWVNQEVLRFRQLGRDNQILALLIEGEPVESFPRALCEIRSTDLSYKNVEPLAADVRPLGNESRRRIRHLAKLKLLATLLGCRFDNLHNGSAPPAPSAQS